MADSWMNSLRGYALSLMRIVIGLTFMSHGLQKVFGLLGGRHLPITSLMGAGGYLELIGGLLILSGLFTRFSAFVLCGEMAFAYFTQHFPHGLWPIVNHGELAVVYCFVFFYLMFSGAGPLSLDRMLRGKQ